VVAPNFTNQYTYVATIDYNASERISGAAVT